MIRSTGWALLAGVLLVSLGGCKDKSKDKDKDKEEDKAVAKDETERPKADAEKVKTDVGDKKEGDRKEGDKKEKEVAKADESKLTRANFDKIKENMTEAAVVDLLGPPSSSRDLIDTGSVTKLIPKLPFELDKTADKLKVKIKQSEWRSKDKSITVHFKDGKVWRPAPSQKGL